MESIRIPFKNDTYGNPIYAKVCWSKETSGSKPIALIYHGGGLMVGSSEIIPKPQIEYLASKGCLVVIPNYRLSPQVTAKEAFADCEEAFDWATQTLPKLMQSEHGIQGNGTNVATMGHSSGGTISLHLASCKPIKAATAFYPSLFASDPDSSIRKPTSAPPFGLMPDFVPTEEDWASISPPDKQLSEAAMAIPGSVPAPRNRWQMSVLKNGQWMETVLPDGDAAAVDPMARVSAQWAPVMLVQGAADNVPGSSLELARRAEKTLREAGVKEVKLEAVDGESHMFDLPPTVGTSDLGPKWVAVTKGLDFLVSHLG